MANNFLSCLNCEVGVRECIESDCKSYINSLPGITLERIVSATDEEKLTFRNLWDEIVDESKVQFSVDFTNKMLECHSVVLQKNGGCDYNALICSNKKLLHSAWKYKLATTFFEFAVYTTRLNRFTTVLGDQNKELLGVYKQKFVDSLSLAVKYIDVGSLCCAPCSGNPESVLWLP